MVRWIGRWVLLVVVSGSVAFGQTVEQNIAARLQHGPFLLLRGMYAGDKLSFDAQGNLIGPANRLPFSLSAVVIDKIELSESELTIQGKHAMLEFEPTDGVGQPRKTRVVGFSKKLHPDLTITIARNPAHPEALDSALQQIFSEGFDDALVNAVPEFWRPWLRHQLDPGAAVDAAPSGVAKFDRKAGISAPVLRYAPDPPRFSEAAKEAHVGGVCVVGLVINAQGRPQESWIVQPMGEGLDEQAIVAVNQYRFKPAMQHGQPVPVKVNIEVHFRIR
ncbi:MAG TPA: energy transducer TonB [Acidobacteriaceae bacterium]|nr:energy transducer TonB [Acidobacteriaceae bacterium]